MIVQDIAGLYIPTHDFVELTYVGSGSGQGEIHEVIYKKGGENGDVVAKMELIYNANNKLIKIKKTDS